MYRFELINNHYIVDINDKKYLIDTGSPTSFSFVGIEYIEIDNKLYKLSTGINSIDKRPIYECIGVKVDGFIGLDIIKQTSLTIYKDGRVDFKDHDLEGAEILMSTCNFLSIKVECNSIIGEFLIDTGAKYGYGLHALFNGKQSFGYVHDYNPGLGFLSGEIYHLKVKIKDHIKNIDICNNPTVASNILNTYRKIMIANITTLFNEVCVIDIKKGKLIIK